MVTLPDRAKLITGVILLATAGALYLTLGPRFGGGDSQLLPALNKADETVLEDDPELPDTTPDITQFGLEAPSLNIKAPVLANVDGEKERLYQQITAKLGVAHLKNSPTPDQKGNVYLFGHSSFWLNYPGQYKELFKELDKLKKDETFTIYYKGTPYTYKVTDNKVVADNDFSVLDGPTPKDANDYTVTIQTCWPPGTDTKRLVVFGVRTN